MRGLETPVTRLRRQVFKEIAKVAYNSQNINDDIEVFTEKEPLLLKEFV